MVRAEADPLGLHLNRPTEIAVTGAAHKGWLTESKRVKRLIFYEANIAQGETEMERRPQIN